MSESPGPWIFLPVLGSPVLHGPVLRSDRLRFLKRPLDGGATLRGRRLFGENKTLRGAVVMTTGPVIAAAALTRVPWFRSKLPPELLRGGGVPYGLVLGLGSVVGELPNSFVKRQLGIAPGGRNWTPSGIVLVLFDQADFVPVTWLLLRPLWRMPLRDALKAFAIVTAIHLGINVVGYAIGARESPILMEADDPLVMYFVVRKDARLGLGEAMVMAGAAADECRVAFAEDARVADLWRAWWPRQRKVALRASAEELESVRAGCLCVGGDTLLCLAPQRRSERSELLAELRPFTDAKAPPEPAPPAPADVPVLAYLIRPGVMKTTGKAMAQAGHAALIGAGPAYPAWREGGRPGEVLMVPSDELWACMGELPGAAVVTDGGLTQVEPGTETVIGLPPAVRGEWPALVRGLERLP